MQCTNALQLAILADAARAASTSAAGTLHSVKVHLFTAGPSLAPDMAVGDFTEATFAGYAAQTLTFGTPYVSQDGNGVMLGVDATFAPSGTLTPAQTVLGYFVTDTAGAVLFAAELLPAPFIFTDATSVLTVIVPWEEIGTARPAIVVT